MHCLRRFVAVIFLTDICDDSTRDGSSGRCCLVVGVLTFHPAVVSSNPVRV